MAAAESGRSIPDFEIQQLHHPSVHQKLQLISQDITYLQKRFLEAAKKKVDAQFPNSGDGKDSLKEETEAIVKQYILKMFEMSRHSLVINGLDGADPSLLSLMKGAGVDVDDESEKYEPYDLDLNEEVRQLYAHIDEETVTVTKLRHEAPLRAVKSYKAQLEKLNEQHKALESDEVDMEDQVEEVTVEDVLPRQKAVEQDFDKLIGTLKLLKKSVPVTTAKLNRAEAALMHLDHVRQN
ncbi:kinetochore protein Mis14 like-domain-containing protein [Lipomyces arxii]|uniref:kinetochore protein Mis14 like-domain-containing protein n=1 Tax=Lipomyces arxii TaxID=56418 RepID=UPI0034CE85F4